MSQTLSPSFARCYGLARVARVWSISRASVYRSLKETPPNTIARRPGPVGACSDAELADHIRRQIAASRLHGEGYRKLWARLRFAGVRASPRRVRRVMRENGLLAPHRVGRTETKPKFALFITASICFAILPGPNLFRIRRSLSIALFTLASDASNFSLNILILSMSASPAAIALSSLSIPSSQKVKLLAFETALCSGPTFNKTKISCINATYAPPVCRHKFSRVSERPNRPDPTSRAIAAHVHSIDGWRRTDGA